jgi:hypothetical protein
MIKAITEHDTLSMTCTPHPYIRFLLHFVFLVSEICSNMSELISFRTGPLQHLIYMILTFHFIKLRKISHNVQYNLYIEVPEIVNIESSERIMLYGPQCNGMRPLLD